MRMKANNILSWFTVILFLILLSLPLYGMLIPGFTGNTGENRNLTKFPKKSELSPSSLEAWFNDNFALRGYMMKIYNRVIAKSGVEIFNNVAIGKENWLYYMADGSKEDIECSLHYTGEELETTCKAQNAVMEYLNTQGIDYYLMVCPDKHTIYPEYLPEGLSGYEGESRFEGMAKAIRENTSIKFADTREAVLKEKQGHDVYYKTDTHWNFYGAFAGYDCLMNLIEKDFPNVRHVKREECTVVADENYHGGDMAGFIGQSETLIDTKITCTVNGSTIRQMDVPYKVDVDVLRIENPDHPEMPSVVIFRDSFASAMYPMLNDSFSRVTYVWTGVILRDVVEYEKPDLVICEYVERYSGNACSAAKDIFEEEPANH